MCLANCSSLKWLFLDYNTLGDYGASCVLVGMAASQSVEILDMEGCGLTEHTGQVCIQKYYMAIFSKTLKLLQILCG